MPPVRERLYEAERGDGLAGAGGVLEPEAAGRPRVLRLLGKLLLLVELAAAVRRVFGVVPVCGLAVLVLVLVARRRLVLVLVVGLLLVDVREVREQRGAVAVLSLGLGDQRRERPGERIHLVRREDSAVDQLGLLVREQALQAEQEGVLLAPFDARLLAAALDLGEGRIQGTAPRRPWAQGVWIRCERLARELLHTFEVLARWNRRDLLGHFSGVSHIEARWVTGGRQTIDSGCNARPCCRRRVLIPTAVSMAWRWTDLNPWVPPPAGTVQMY